MAISDLFKDGLTVPSSHQSSSRIAELCAQPYAATRRECARYRFAAHKGIPFHL